MGPTMTPASTIPTIWGMRSLPIIMGAKRMMHSTTKNINVGAVMGKNCDISGINIRYVANLYAKVQKKSYFAVIGLKVVLLYRIISRLIYFVIK